MTVTVNDDCVVGLQDRRRIQSAEAMMAQVAHRRLGIGGQRILPAVCRPVAFLIRRQRSGIIGASLAHKPPLRPQFRCRRPRGHPENPGEAQGVGAAVAPKRRGRLCAADIFQRNELRPPQKPQHDDAHRETGGCGRVGAAGKRVKKRNNALQHLPFRSDFRISVHIRPSIGALIVEHSRIDVDRIDALLLIPLMNLPDPSTSSAGFAPN